MQIKRMIIKIYHWLAHPLHASWGFYAMIFGVLLGITCCLITRLNFTGHWLWLVVASLCLVVVLARPLRILIPLAVVAGFLIADFRVGSELVGQEYFAALTGETVTLTGTLTESPSIEGGTVKIRISNLEIHLPNARGPTQENQETGPTQGAEAQQDIQGVQEIQSVEVTQKVSGTIYAQLSGSSLDLQRSDRVVLKGKIGTGFGVFVANMFRPELLAIERNEPGDIFERIRHQFADLIKKYIPSPEADLGLGYLMGMSDGLSESFSAALKTVGMTHIIVASGTHLGILVGAARKTFGKLSRFASAFFSLLLIIGFVLIVGFTPSMTRAALVASITLLLGCVGRKIAPWRLLRLVAAITLLISPMYLLNLGWQLSFASFFGILMVGPTLTKIFYGGKPPPWLAKILLASLATCLTCAPILAYNFGTISLLSFMANLLILPTLPYVMLLLLLTGLVSFWPFLATLIGHLTTWALDFHISVVNYLSTKTMFVLTLQEGDARIFLLYIIVAIILLIPALLKNTKNTECIS